MRVNSMDSSLPAAPPGNPGITRPGSGSRKALAAVQLSVFIVTTVC